MLKQQLLFLLLGCLMSVSAYSQQFRNAKLQVTFEGRYTDGRDGACEIADFEPTKSLVVVTNAASDSIDIIDWSTLSSPVKIGSAAVLPYGGGANSVAVIDTAYFAVAVEDTIKQDSGKVVFYDYNGNYVNHVMVGALPDMIKLTPNGQQLLVACEGEPNDSYTVDPEGGIGIIDLAGGIPGLTQSQVTLLDFQGAPASITGGIFKPNTSIAQDLEPEYIAVNPASTRAAVVCQENNVLILVDLTNKSILSYKGLGFKDHSQSGNGFDASNRDNAIDIRTHNVKGAYQPDAIVGFESRFNGNVYFATANEGDARDYPGYSSETRIGNLTLDGTAFPNASALQQDAELGRLKTFTADVIGDTDGDGDVDELYSYGARSVSIWDDAGNLVWDSGDAIEQYIAANFPDFFNCNDGLASEKDARSDDKGPEPEALAVIKFGPIIGGGPSELLALGLERQGGIVIFDVANPLSPTLELFVHSYDTVAGTMIDIAPEGIVVIDQPDGSKLMLVSNEVSGTIAAYSIVPVGLGVETPMAPSTWHLQPNPVQDQLQLYLEEQPQTTLQYEVYNALGQRVAAGQCVDQMTTLSTQTWAPGQYVVRLLDVEKGTEEVQQVVKR